MTDPEIPVGTSSDEVDLTPRTAPPVRASRSRSAKRWTGVGVLVVVLGVAGFAVAQALNDAALFFRHVDEAVAEREELGTDRFRIHGIVEPGTVEAFPGSVSFVISYNGVTAEVDHTGDPIELFQPDIPVLLEGRWSNSRDDAVFLSDRMLVKHDEVYEADHGERLDDDDGYGDDDGYDYDSEAVSARQAGSEGSATGGGGTATP